MSNIPVLSYPLMACVNRLVEQIQFRTKCERHEAEEIALTFLQDQMDNPELSITDLKERLRVLRLRQSVLDVAQEKL